MRFRLLFVLFASMALIASGCGGDDTAEEPVAGDDAADEDGADDATGDAGADEGEDDTSIEDEAAPEPTATPEPTPEPAPEPNLPTEVAEATGGNGVALPLFNAPLPEGYTETEWLVGGGATSYLAVGEHGEDGVWAAEPDATAPYRTRMIVRTPPADAFSGVVVVEWFNVTAGTDSSPDWGYLSEEVGRSGHAYVGVSVQAVGLNGVDEGRLQEGLVDTRGLIVRDPERYGTLEHPGDAYAFDIFTQAGAAAAGLAGADVLGGLEPTHVIGMGESQSAIFMTTYVNAVHPLAGLYDGFLIHSRGDNAPEVTGARALRSDDGEEVEDDPIANRAVRFRTDQQTPVFVYAAETDVNLLEYARARQDDSEFVHTWEVAGTAHSDAWALAIAGGLAPDPSLGNFIGCTVPINDGPHPETLMAALHHLVAWVVDGTPPPPGERIGVEGLDTDGAELTIVRDDLGLAVGGVRTPVVDAPLRVLSGDPGGDEQNFCFLFGQTLPIELDALVARYGDLAGYQAEVEAAAEASIAAGWILPDDAAEMVERELARAAELGLE